MLSIRSMTTADLPLGLRLSHQAGWNQLEADWRRMLDLEPEGGFVAEWNGLPVATTVAVTFGEVAWIAMVLVDEAYRGRGIARKLMSEAIAWLDERRVTSIRLDATPLGRTVYERLGFRSQFELHRWDGVVQSDSDAPVALTFQSLPSQVFPLDAEVTSTARQKLLSRLMADNPQSVIACDGGYGLSRPGALAEFVGPCVAQLDVGPRLLRELLRRRGGQRVFVDIPQDNSPAEALAREHGLQAQRPLTRMVRGKDVCEDLRRYWASSGPELG